MALSNLITTQQRALYSYQPSLTWIREKELNLFVATKANLEVITSYCFCKKQLIKNTTNSPFDILPIAAVLSSRAISGLSGNKEHTITLTLFTGREF